MYDEIFYYKNSDFTIAYKNGKAGLIDVNTGKPITEFIYDIIKEKNRLSLSNLIKSKDDDDPNLYIAMLAGISKDYCTMSKNHKWGLLNKEGKVVLDFKYKYPIELLNIFRYISGYYIVNADGYEGVLDENSNIILEPVYDHIMDSNLYWSCEKDNLFGLADINGKMAVDIKYSFVSAASMTKPYFIAQKKSKYGLITLNDEIISDFVYGHLTSEKDGEFYIGMLNGKYGVINYKGEIILDFKFDYITSCSNSDFKLTFLTKYKGKQEVFDENGEKLWD